MKKTILALATAVSFNAATSLATENTFYVKANAGYYRLLDAKLEDYHSNQSLKFRSKNGDFFFGLGFGYNINEKLRVDLVFDHFVNPLHKWSWDDTDGDFVRNKIKGSIDSLTLNSYVDLFDINNIKLFAGAGLGAAQTKAKVSSLSRLNGIDLPDESGKFKTSTNFTYSLHFGVSTKLTDNIHTELAYSWRDFGKIEGKSDDGEGGMPYKGHHLALGIRYDI